MKTAMCVAALLALAGAASAQTFDGNNIQADALLRGMPQVAQTNTPTGFGNANNGLQAANGSELNAAWGTIKNGKLLFSATGNIESNFNKVWFFLDGIAGGENTLLNDNVDGGFGEINSMAGMTFDSGFSPDRAIRFEVGNGFFGVRQANLIANTGGDIWTGGGPGDLPRTNNAGGFGVTYGWDNSNTAGVDGSSAAGALTADKGWEFEIDLATFFGDGSLTEVRIQAFITNPGGGFLALNNLNAGTYNQQNSANFNWQSVEGVQYFTVVPAPGAAALLALGGLVGLRRRR